MKTTTPIPQLTDIPDTERRDEYLLTPAEEQSLLVGHPWSRFAVVGDSIALGMGDPSDGYATATWGGRVAAALARATDTLAYANFAEHGATAEDICALQLDRVLDFEPDLVAIVAGGNDVLAEEFDVAATKRSIDEIVATLKAARATVVTYELLDFEGAFPDAGFDELNTRLLDLYRAMREISFERRTIHVDLYSEPWARERYCFSKDLRHPTMRAQALCASATVRALGGYLGRTRDATAPKQQV